MTNEEFKKLHHFGLSGLWCCSYCKYAKVVFRKFEDGRKWKRKCVANSKGVFLEGFEVEPSDLCNHFVPDDESLQVIEDILREMRTITSGEECCPDCGADFKRSNRWPEFADRIEAAWRRERVAIEADALNAGALVEAFRRQDEKKFDKAEFDKAVSGPSAWDAVEDPVAEVRKMRGDKEARND